MNAMLFAAGLGTRMRPLTDTRAKPLIEVAGKPLIDHALALCQNGPVGQIVVNVHHHADQMRRHLVQAGVLISDESEKLLETGGGLRHALPLLGPDPVFTLNTDMVWNGANPLRLLEQHWANSRADALLLVQHVNRVYGRTGAGDFSIDGQGQLTRGGDYLYLGAQIIRTNGIRTIDAEAFSLNVLWEEIAARGRLYGAVYTGDWCDVGTPAGITAAERMLAEDCDV